MYLNCNSLESRGYTLSNAPKYVARCYLEASLEGLEYRVLTKFLTLLKEVARGSRSLSYVTSTEDEKCLKYSLDNRLSYLAIRHHKEASYR